MTDNEPDDEVISEDARLLLYQDQIDRIRDLKANQWRISHYGVLAQIAYIALPKFVESSVYLNYARVNLAVVTLLVVLIWSDRFQNLIVNRRHALVDLSKCQTKSFFQVRRTLRKKRKKPSKRCRWTGDWWVLVTILFVQGIAMLIALWTILYPSS